MSKKSTAKPVVWYRVEPPSPGYPWEFACLHTNNFPTPGTFVDLNEQGWFDVSHGFDALVRSMLFSALVMADADQELANSRTSQARRLRQAVRELIWNEWNMGLYAVSNENMCCGVHPEKPGGEGRSCVVDHVMDETGHGLCWSQVHSPNLIIMSAGRAPTRAIDPFGKILPGVDAKYWPLLWLPAIDLERMGAVDPEVTVATWPDGSPCTTPPISVERLGIQDPVALPGMPTIIEQVIGRHEMS